MVQLVWVVAGLLLWKGPLVTGRDERTGQQTAFLLDTDRTALGAVDTAKLNNFFMNPQHVTRNLVVCSALVGPLSSIFLPLIISLYIQFLITATFWFLPSLLWKKTHLLAVVPIPGAGAGAGKVDSLDMSPDITRLPLSLDTMDTLDRAEERVTGVYTALVDSGLGDLYNRVLCPTCIVQIVIINTMVVSGAVCRYIYVISIL